MTFEVRVRDAEGHAQAFVRVARSRTELVAQLREEGLLVLTVSEVHEKSPLPPAWHPAWLLPMTRFDVEIALRQLAALLRSGVTLLAALKTLAISSRVPRANRTWLQVSEGIAHGQSFAASLAAHRRHFDEVVVRLVEVGERSGELAVVVARAADQLESRRNLRTQVINALVYPCLAVVMAIAVIAFLVVCVIPKIADFLKAGGAELPAITQALMDVSAWVTANGLYVVAGLGAFAFGWFLVRFTAVGREGEDALLLRIPIVGRILRLSASALFARTMQIMTVSGVTLLAALETVASLMANRRVARHVRVARAEVMRGRSLAESLVVVREFMPMMLRMVSVGEVTGALPETFDEAARFHEMLLALAIKRFSMLIEPVMICVTGVIVGFVYVAFFMAIFAIAGTN